MAAVHPRAVGEHGVGHGRAVVVGTAVAGLLVVVLGLAWSYSYAVGHPHRRDGHQVAPLPYWSPFFLIPLVALVGARLAPDRTRAVVVAGCAAHVLLVLATKGALLVDPTRLGFGSWLELWAGEVVLVLLAWLGARAGRHLALR